MRQRKLCGVDWVKRKYNSVFRGEQSIPNRAVPTSSITQSFSLTIEEDKKSTSQITKTRYSSVLKSELDS